MMYVFVAFLLFIHQMKDIQVIPFLRYGESIASMNGAEQGPVE